MPQVHWKLRVHGPPTCLEMTFCSTNSSLGGVGPMVSRRSELVLDISLLKELLGFLWAFIIHAMEFGLAASSREGIMHILDSLC